MEQIISSIEHRFEQTNVTPMKVVFFDALVNNDGVMRKRSTMLLFLMFCHFLIFRKP